MQYRPCGFEVNQNEKKARQNADAFKTHDQAYSTMVAAANSNSKWLATKIVP